MKHRTKFLEDLNTYLDLDHLILTGDERMYTKAYEIKLNATANKLIEELLQEGKDFQYSCKYHYEHILDNRLADILLERHEHSGGYTNDRM